MSDVFDPVQFADQVITESLDTKLVPIPIGSYQAVAEKFQIRQNAGKKDPTQVYVSLDITWEILDENVKAAINRDKATVTQGILIDIDNGRLAVGPGKNIGLGKLREALSLNIPGEPFSLAMIPGRMAKVTIMHEPYNGEIYSKVKTVEAL